MLFDIFICETPTMELNIFLLSPYNIMIVDKSVVLLKVCRHYYENFDKIVFMRDIPCIMCIPFINNPHKCYRFLSYNGL